MADPIRVLIVDDQQLIRDGLRAILESETDILVVGEAKDGETALAMIPQLQPQVVLMDIKMAGIGGIAATHKIREQWKEVQVIILTTFSEDELIFEGLKAGASGFLLKDTSASELIKAIRTVAAGGALIEPSIAGKVFAEFQRLSRNDHSNLSCPSFTERESEILKLLCQGYSNRQIAEQLYLAEGTVKNYLSAIL
jgi:DNA-binding NarL/FixJ family response regulator